MRTSVRHAFSLGTVAAVLAGCGGSQFFRATPSSYYSPASLAQPLAGYRSLYSFNGRRNGHFPEARLIAVNGTLYGTTSAGGIGCELTGCGTVFAISTSGSEKVLHRFRGLPDGAKPLAELTVGKSLLFGTTYSGGTVCHRPSAFRGCGTVFSIAPSGTERVMHRFGGAPDGAYPRGPVVDVRGTLYGTTTYGGVECGRPHYGCGTVYSVSSSGNERVLYRFSGLDGENPTGNLLLLHGKLYGTTVYGGTCNGGTVFEITVSGRERIVYDAGCTPGDIAYPSGLVAVDGVLYGTSYGGIGNAGAVYSVTTRGEERVLYSFNGRNGDDPVGSLVAIGNELYGATSDGGYDYGNVYSLRTSGALRVLYRFKGVPDGSLPDAGLVNLNGTLYGTTSSGGSGCRYQYCQNGYGTVFRISP